MGRATDGQSGQSSAGCHSGLDSSSARFGDNACLSKCSLEVKLARHLH